MIYSFQDIISSVEISYIIFFTKVSVEIDLRAKIRPGVSHSETRFFNIVNGLIDWTNVDNQMISIDCQIFCDKIQKLRAFS